MGFSRSRTLYFIALFALAALSLRPHARVDAALDLVFAPTRALAELLLPLRVLRSRTVRAAERSISERADGEQKLSLELLAVERAQAEPVDPALRAARAWIHAEVVDEVADDGAIEIRCAAGAPLEVGLPVVCGDAYVGRIASLGARGSGEARVALITAESFRVGGRVAAAPAAQDDAKSAPVSAAEAEVVVGGLVAAPDDDPSGIYLAVHAPSRRDLACGGVRVGEIGKSDALAALAEGFRLGELARYDVRGVPVLALRAGIDYEGGLAQVVVLAPADRHIPAPALLGGRFDAEHWIPARFALAGDPSYWRDGRRLCAGRRDGIEPRAVVAAGARYLGSVTRVGELTSDVSLLGDPGLSITVLAAVTVGDARVPIALGRLTSEGRDRASDRVLLRWEAPIPVLAPEGPRAAVPALLFTGSGDRDVPAGLWIGATELPRGRGPFVLHVDVSEPLASLQRVRVLRRPREEPKP